MAGIPTLQKNDHKAIIELNRPDHHNRIEPQDLKILSELLTRLENDYSIRVLIFTASGKSFSSGYHLGDLRAVHAQTKQIEVVTDASPTPFSQLADQLEQMRMPTICALNGPVYGGSTDLALACDFRIGVSHCKMFMPAARLGMHYYAGGLRRAVERLGLAAAKKLYLTAVTLEAEEMLRIGYLDETVAPEKFMVRVHELADTIAANAPAAVCSMKRFLNQIASGVADKQAIDAAHNASQVSAEAREGIAAWFEKRSANFADFEEKSC